MNIVVLIKQVPDTWTERRLRESDKTVDRESLQPVANEMDDHALEEALRLRELHGGMVTVLSMGPSHASVAIRRALAMGADEAVQLTDDALHGSCAPGTSTALGAALQKLEFDLVVLGAEASDARVGAMGSMLAERLGLPALTYASNVTVEGRTVRIERATDKEALVLEGELPAVLSVTEKVNEPRYPSFKGQMEAKKKQIRTLDLDEIGVDADRVGLVAATSEVVDFTSRPLRVRGEVVVDNGDGVDQLLGFLAGRDLI